MKKQQYSTVTKYVLYAAFFVLMLTSIKHVSWAFHSIDGQSDKSVLSWVLPVLCAVGIDASVGAISFFLTSRKGLGYKSAGYTFMSVLVALSWFANWLYAKQFMPETQVWSGTLFRGAMKVSWVAPIVYGSLPVLVFAFALIIDFLMSERMTPDELEERLIEQDKFREVRKKYNQESKVRTVFAPIKEVKKEVLSLFDNSSVPNEETNTEQKTEQKTEQNTEPTTDPELEIVHNETPDETPANVLQFDQSEANETLKQKVLELITNEPGITNVELIKRTGISKSHLSGIRNKRKSSKM